MKRFLEGLRPTLHISHRGGAALAPENTLEAFTQAVERYQTQMLELDVHLSRDGEWFVAHDATLDRCTDGTGPLAARTRAELGALDAGFHFELQGSHPFRGRGVRLPLLREVLRTFPTLRLNIELKEGPPGAVESFATLLEQEGAVDRVCVGSEVDAVGERLAERLPQACHFYPRDALTAFVLAIKAGEDPPEDDRYTVLDMPLFFQGIRLFDAPLREAATARGKWINLWTIDDPSSMRTLIEEGVGGIMTDRPDLLRAALDQAKR